MKALSLDEAVRVMQDTLRYAMRYGGEVRRRGMRICLWMMIKRMGKHPVYWILLFLFPTAVFVVPKLNGTVREEQIPVGYVIVTSEGEETESGELFDRIEENLSEKELSAGEAGEEEGDVADREEAAFGTGQGEIFRYVKYAGTDQMKEDILTGKLSCGVVFDKNFMEKIRTQDYYHCIRLYLPEGMNVGGLVQEDLFRRVYQAYSAMWFAELLKEQGYQIDSEEVLQKFSEYQKEGKVFAVNYEFQTEEEGVFQNVSEGQNGTDMLSLRGILAFLTLLSALLGALEGGRDRKRNLGKGIGCPGRLAMASVGAPILPAVLFLAVGMVVYHVTLVSGMEGELAGTMYGALSRGGEIAGIAAASLREGTAGEFCLTEFLTAEILPEFGSAVLYGFVLWLCAIAVSRLVPVKVLEGAAPCVLLIVLLCCPILFDLGETVPLIGHISRLFPITWYLEFWG